MDEIDRARTIVAALDLDDKSSRTSLLGKLLCEHEDSIELDTLELYFNRNPKGEQIDLQVGSCVFNLSEWANTQHKLAEMLLLKGASIEDLEKLHELTRKHADNS